MNVQDILNKRGIQYVENGGDYLISCLSPEHTDSNPSMRVDKIKGMFNCFSCGYKGSIYSHFGIEKNLNHAKIVSIKEKIAAKYKQKLTMPRGYDPFQQDFRGISAKTINEFNGFMHGDFEDRIVFPITDIFGDISCFIGRYIASDAKPKYKIYPDRAKPPLFPALPEIKDGNVILVEGILDMLRLYDLGIKNVMTGFGLAVSRKRDVEKLNPLKLMGVSSITVLFDGDRPGEEAAYLFEKHYENDFVIFNRRLPKGEDPCSLSDSEIFNLI